MVKLMVVYGPPTDRAAFESDEALRAAMASPAGQATVADVANFATGGATVLIAQVD
jgi:uncharacterized protein (TIGR02118 family)